MKREQKFFKNISCLEDLGNSIKKEDPFNRNLVYSVWLEDYGMAILFSYCEQYLLTFAECLFLIQKIAKTNIKENPNNIFSNCEKKENYITIWVMLKKYFDKSIGVYEEVDEITLLPQPPFEEYIYRKVKIGKDISEVSLELPIGKKIKYMKPTPKEKPQRLTIYTKRDLKSLLELMKQKDINATIEVNQGAMYKLFECQMEPEDATKIINQEEIEALLKVKPIRICYNNDSKLLQIVVPNRKKEILSLSYWFKSENLDKKQNLMIPLGKGKDKDFFLNLKERNRILIIGAPNSGKTISINGMISFLLKRNSPSQMRLVLIDTLKKGFSMYEGIPHLLTSPISDIPSADHMLLWLTAEADRRHQILDSVGMSLKTYRCNQKKMPDIVVFIDEFSDLFLKRKNTELCLNELFYKGKEVGIYVVISSNQIRRDVLTPKLCRNLNEWISFKRNALKEGQMIGDLDVSKIIDNTRSTHLFEYGDMILGDHQRIQGVYVTKQEIDKLCKKIKKKYKSKEPSIDLMNLIQTIPDINITEGVLYAVARQCVKLKRFTFAEILILFQFGYKNTLLIFEELEKRKLISIEDDKGIRKALIDFPTLKDMFSNLTYSNE